MKIFYTTDGSVDQELQQVCPFGELHHFKRNDGSEFTMNVRVGCQGCTKCSYCYGAGFHSPYGSKPKHFSLIPKVFTLEPYDYDKDEKEKLKLGLKQFKFISDTDYIKCAKGYTKISKQIKFKIWWWHNIGIKIQDFEYFIEKHYLDLKFKIYDCSHKWFKRI